MIKFYLKVILKSPLIIISLLFSIFILLVQSSILNYSITSYTRVTFYAYISFNLFFLLSCTYSMNKNYEIGEFLETNIFKKFISILLASLVISSLIFLIPLSIVIFYACTRLNSSNLVGEIFNFFLLWNSSNLLSSIIGCCIGLLVNKWYSYIFSFILYSGYISVIYGPPKSIFSRLICIFSDNIYIEENCLAPLLFNIPYILDKIFILLILMAIINIVYLIIKKKRSSAISVISLIVIISLLIYVIPSSNKFAKIGTEFYDNFSTSDYIIESYKMDLDVTYILNNSCEVKLKALKSTNNLILMLDNTFNIDSISINDIDSEFEHTNNKIIINYNLEEDQVIKIKFNYSGFVDISNYLGVNTYYVSNKYINLPNKNFYWYPYINNESSHNFNINLKTHNNIYTNLNIDNTIDDNGIYKYELSGNDIGFSLFAGEYTTINFNDITYIIPKKYKIDSFTQYIDNLPTRLLQNDSSSECKRRSNILKNKQYKKVIVCDWFSFSKEQYLENEIQFFNDTIIINLGV